MHHATDTQSYYEAHASEFVDRTLHLDMSGLRWRFADLLPPGGAILDAGCGSGRDAKAFADEGFRVTAFDASSAMVGLARRHTGLPVLRLRFQDLEFESMFDGIWACASLLHVPITEELRVFEKLVQALKPGGVLYVSYKRGEGERMEAGRLFRDHTRASLERVLGSLLSLKLLESWQSADRRPGKADVWVNGLARKHTNTAGSA